MCTVPTPVAKADLTCIYSKSPAALQSISMESRAGSRYLHGYTTLGDMPRDVSRIDVLKSNGPPPWELGPPFLMNRITVLA